LWVGLWLVLPIYAIYCRSVTDFAGPKEWWTASTQFLAGHNWVDKSTGEISIWFWIFFAFASATVAVLIFIFPRFRRVMVWLFPMVAGASLVVCLLLMGLPAKTIGTTTHTGYEWVGTLARPIGQWTDWMSDHVVIIALTIVLPGLALFYCANDWLGR